MSKIMEQLKAELDAASAAYAYATRDAAHAAYVAKVAYTDAVTAAYRLWQDALERGIGDE